MMKKIILILSFIFLLTVAFIYYFYELKKINSTENQTTASDKERLEEDEIDESMIKKIKEDVGEDYFKDNFLLSKAYWKNNRSTGFREVRYLEFKFLPFSDEHDFYITVNYVVYDFPEGFSYSFSDSFSDVNTPKCVYKKKKNRCNFPVSYSEAYNTAVDDFKAVSGKVRVTLKEIEGGYLWGAFTKEEREGMRYFYRYNINVVTGEKTEMETNSEPAYIHFD